MWRINSIFIFLFLNFLTIEIQASEIWNEEFSTPYLGVWGDADGTTIHVDTLSTDKWHLNVDQCSFSAENDYVKTVSTSGGRFEALDCDGKAIWASEWINISKFQDVNCELTARETGSGNKVDKKYLKAYYQINNGEETLFETNGISEGNWSSARVSQSGLNADSMRIIVYLNSSYASDKVIMDDVRVWSDQPERINENQLARKGEVLINEVLFNPYPDGVDFVEIYNNSEKTIRLDHLFLANRNDNLVLEKIVPISTEEQTIPAYNYLVLSEDQEKILLFYETGCPACFLDIDNLPAYNNDQGNVVLLNDSLDIIDEMYYEDKMHHRLLTGDEGVSLERISWQVSGLEPSNWMSAKSAVKFATPGYQNSVDGSMAVGKEEILIEPKVFSPNGDGYHDYLSIRYHLTNPDYIANLKIFDSHGQPVCNLVNNEPTGMQGEWIWLGTNNEGDRTRLGLYIVFLELHDSKGNVKQFKKVCTVTDRL